MLQAVARITIFQGFKNNELNNNSIIKPRVFQFYSYHSITINNSWDNIIQTAKVILPKRIRKLGCVEYTFEDYFSIFNEIQTGIIEDNISGLGSSGSTQSSITPQTPPELQGSTHKIKNYIDLTEIDNDGNLMYSILNQSDNVNNGKIFRNGFRVNPLIKREDIIIIELGYIIKNKIDGSVINTIATYNHNDLTIGGNIGLGSEFSQILPSIYSFNFPIDGQYNINNRYKPINRSNIFRGYVTKTTVNNDGNILLDCEDYMYTFGRAKIPNFTYNSYDTNLGKVENIIGSKSNEKILGWTLLSMFDDMFDGTKGYKYSNGIGRTVSGIQNAALLPMTCIQSTTENGIADGFFTDKADFGLVQNPNFGSINENYTFNIRLGSIQTSNNTILDVFKSIKDDYNFPIYFIPNTDILMAGPFVYNAATQSEIMQNGSTQSEIYNGLPGNPSIGQEKFIFITGNWSPDSDRLNKKFMPKLLKTFKNRQNIISSNLEYRKVEDQFAGAYVTSIYRIDDIDIRANAINVTRDGRKKKKKFEHTIFVGDVGGITYQFFYLISSATTQLQIINNQVVPIDFQSLSDEMYKYGDEMLKRVHYTGYFGDFTTFGYPYVQFGDIVTLVDLSFPERSGSYYIKRVIYNADIDSGLSQTITLDYKIPNQVPFSIFPGKVKNIF